MNNPGRIRDIADGTITLYLEALRPSATLGGHTIKLQAVLAEEHTDPITGDTQTLLAHSYVETKKVPYTAAAVDLDVDSFNDSGFAVPGPANHNEEEDAAEDRGKAAKFPWPSTIDWADFNGIAGAWPITF